MMCKAREPDRLIQPLLAFARPAAAPGWGVQETAEQREANSLWGAGRGSTDERMGDAHRPAPSFCR